jgi:1,4-alpha-glucan branching enzyme
VSSAPPSRLGQLDLHLIGEGRHERLWTVLGADAADEGVWFGVWARNAAEVRVAGDFDGWAEGVPMTPVGGGVWEAFLPAAHPGQRYKFRMLGPDGGWREKADPLARYAEAPPGTASVIYRSRYEWGDQEWLAGRSDLDPHRAPVSIYELHLGSWRPGLGYRELADPLVAYVTELGFTHVELLPVMEHPYGGSWGYQVTGYYAPTARWGEPDDLRYLIDRLHQAGIGVILDWSPAHFPRDDWALARFDGTPLYEHADRRRGEHPDWGTYVFDYGRPEVRNFLVANALYWCEEFHVDGLRVDAVASMLYLDYSRGEGGWAPNQFGGKENLEAISFLQELNATVRKLHPGVMTIAEESTTWPGVTAPPDWHGLGFTFKWNMGWMHDTLSYVGVPPADRSGHHNRLTFSLTYAWSERYVLPISHDEVVHGKRPLVGKVAGDTWQQLAGVRALLGLMWAHPGKQLLFMGCELADRSEWSDIRGPDWGLLDDPAHAGVWRLVRDLNAAYRATAALWSADQTPDGFRWITADDAAGSTYSFLRFGPGRDEGWALACVTNFSATVHESYRIGLPASGRWTEILNTDADNYGGSGVGNLGVVRASPIPWHGLSASATLRVPPLGTVWLRHTPPVDTLT